jgi:hypothetical protein
VCNHACRNAHPAIGNLQYRRRSNAPASSHRQSSAVGQRVNRVDYQIDQDFTDRHGVAIVFRCVAEVFDGIDDARVRRAICWPISTRSSEIDRVACDFTKVDRSKVVEANGATKSWHSTRDHGTVACCT